MRVKTGTVRHQKHQKILKQAKGYWLSNRKRVKLAKQALLHAGEYAFAGRKLRKRDFRRLWIQRINAGLTDSPLNYSQFMDKLKKANIKLNRKILADLVLNHPQVFSKIVDTINK